MFTTKLIQKVNTLKNGKNIRLHKEIFLIFETTDKFKKPIKKFISS